MARKRPLPSPPSSQPSPRRLRGNSNTPRKNCNESSPRKRLFDDGPSRPRWNPKDPAQMKAVKEALHVSWAPGEVVCREREQEEILEFCKARVAAGKPGSLLVCGCPGTGKTLSVERVKSRLLAWTESEGLRAPRILMTNCTTLSTPRLQDLYPQDLRRGAALLILDEIDYLSTRDGVVVLRELFMLAALPSSELVLVGISNAIDLAERLGSLDCKPKAITFHAYTSGEIARILRQRLEALGYDDVFQPLALEFCARKVAAASGDMRRALGACISALELLEAEMNDSVVNFDHMDMALAKAFRPAVVGTIQSLPQHQQVILCSLVKMRGIKNTAATRTVTLGDLNRCYLDTCRSVQVPAVGMLEFSSMCQVLGDQGLLKITQARQEKMKCSVALLADSADITFALKGIRFFRTCLE